MGRGRIGKTSDSGSEGWRFEPSRPSHLKYKTYVILCYPPTTPAQAIRKHLKSKNRVTERSMRYLILANAQETVFFW